jgi:hypothetical protein
MDTPLGSSSQQGDGASLDTLQITSEWILQTHQQQQEVNARVMAELQESRRQQAEANERLIVLLQGRNSPPRTHVPRPVPIVVEPELTRRPKHSLSHPDKYDGEDKTEYLPFKGHLRAKLRIDQAAIGGETEQVWYAYGRLSGRAAARIFPWIDTMERQSIPLRVTRFFEELDSAFLDRQMSQRALEWVNTKRQGSQSFRDFLQTFEQKLLEAGAWEFPDAIRKGYLKAAINIDIKSQLVALAEPEAYSEYVTMVQRTSDNIDELKRLKRHRTGWSSAPSRKPDTAEPMDWEATPRAASGRNQSRDKNDRWADDERPRAKWVDTETVEKRRQDGTCLRCGKDGHFVVKCKYRPPLKPKKTEKVVSHAKRNKKESVTVVKEEPSSEEGQSSVGSDSDPEKE